MIYAHIKKFDWFPFSHDIQTRVFSKFTLLHGAVVLDTLLSY